MDIQIKYHFFRTNILTKRNIAFLVLFVLAFSVKAQDKNNLIQLYGKLYNDQSEPLPYAHILIMNNDHGTITNKDGKFSLVVNKNDTIMFSSLGYKRKTMIIPDTLSGSFLHRDIFLKTDTFMIKEVEVYPWKSYDEFKEALLNLKLPDKDVEIARKNIALIRTQMILEDSPDPAVNFNDVMQQQYKKTFSQGTYPTYKLFNVFAWRKFIEALKHGDFNQNKK